MKLIQTLEHPVSRYWDGSQKQRFEWEIECLGGGSDSKGTFVRIGSLDANTWFNVAEGKTEKITLCNAMRHLKAITRIPSKFEFVT